MATPSLPTHHPIIQFAFSNVKVESVDKGSFQAKCKFCKFGGGIVKFTKKSYSNLSRHLKCYHFNAYKTYLDKINNESLDARGKSMMKSYFQPSSLPIDTTQSILSSITTHEVPSVSCNTNISSTNSDLTEAPLPLKIDTYQDNAFPTASASPSNISEQPAKPSLSSITTQEVPSVSCNTNISSINSDLTEAPLPLKIDTNQANAHPTASASPSNISEQPAKPSHSSSPIRKIQPVLMYKPLCTSCIALSNAEYFYKNTLKLVLAECTHKNNDCCCKRKYEELHARAAEDKPEVSHENANTFDGSTFLCQYDGGKDRIIHYCKVCLRRGYPSKGKRRIGESWTEGITFTSTRKKNKAMKAHLQSQQHKESLEFCKSEDEIQIKLGHPTKEEREKATRNTMIAGIFMTSHSLPFRLYTALCALLSLICPSRSSNPLGNVHQTHSGIRNVLVANYEACATTMKRYLNSTFEATKSKRKFTISCDKGTAPKDVTRQAVVLTLVSESGMPKEMVLGVPMIRQGDALATTNHLKENVALFLDPSSVAFVCTDGAAVYTGKKTGMIEMLKTSDEYQTLNGLPDFCHKTENLLQKSMPKWVSDTLSDCRTVSAFVNDHNIVKNIIHRYININRGSSFTTIPNQSQTRFAEYLHLHLDAILKNLPILIEALPELIYNQSFLSDKTKGILKLIVNESFVMRIMFIRRLYKLMSEKEKMAQDSCFGPFQYKHLVDSLASELQELKTPSIDIENFVNDGNVKSHSPASCHTEYDYLNLSEIALKLNLKTRGELEGSRKDRKNVLIKENSEWIDQICTETHNYLKIPEPIALATQLFSLHTKNHLEDKSAAIKKLFNTVNLQFEPCGSECKGVDECVCLISDYNKFMAIFETEWQAVTNNRVVRDGTSISQSYTHAFAHYIAKNNNESAYPTNMIRCLEIIQLMKPSQSATERVMSHVANTVKNRFESKNQFRTESSEVDCVNLEVFLRCNTNMVLHDAELAKNIFLKKHRESQMKTKPSCEQSKSVSSYLSELGREDMKNSFSKRRKDHKSNESDGKKRKIDSWLFKAPAMKEVSGDLNNSSVPMQTCDYLTEHETKVLPMQSTSLPSKSSHQAFNGKNKQPLEGKLNFDFAKQTCKVEEKVEVYCICQIRSDERTKAENSSHKWIGCANAKKCESYIARMDKESVEGGDWFHLKCLKMKRIPVGDWFCEKCSQNKILKISQKLEKYKCASKTEPVNISQDFTLQDLTKHMADENRTIKKIIGDGNCLYRCLAFSLYRDEELHLDIRKILSSKLLSLVDDPQWEKKWTVDSWKTPESQAMLGNNSDAMLVHSLVKFYGTKLTKSASNIVEGIKCYADKIKYPTKNMDKYGGSLELLVFACLFKKNVYTLQKITSPPSYKWSLIQVYNVPAIPSGPLNYISLLYHSFPKSPVLNHYDIIVANNTNSCNAPDTQIIYTKEGCVRTEKKSETELIQIN